MGVRSSLLNDDNEEKIEKRLKEVIRTFRVEFSKAYTQVVIKAAKEEIEPSMNYGNGRMLSNAPSSTTNVKSGVLFKRGDVRKSWKARFVIIHNETENYEVEYFDGEDANGKRKGIIVCAGYTAYEFTKDEIVEFGESGIKLVPRTNRHRTWYFRCSDDKERESWLLGFRVACFKARPPRDRDQTIADAFESSIVTMQWRCGIWGGYVDCGTEGERLSDLLLSIINKEILLKALPDAEKRAVYLQSINKKVMEMSTSAWIFASSEVKSVSDMIHAHVHQHLELLLKKRAAFKESIADRVRGLAVSCFEDCRGSIIFPVLHCISRPYMSAFLSAAAGFYNEMKIAVSTGQLSLANIDRYVEQTRWGIDSWTNDLMRSADEHICKIYEGRKADLATTLFSGISMQFLHNLAKDRVADILRRGLATFTILAADIIESEHEEVLSHVMGLLFHDCISLVQQTVRDVLHVVLVAAVQEKLLSPAIGVLQPVQDAIDNVHPTAVSTLLDMDTMLLEVVNWFEDETLAEVCADFDLQVQKGVRECRDSLGIAPIYFEERHSYRSVSPTPESPTDS